VSFLEALPRYFMESTLAIGLVVIGGVTVLSRGSSALPSVIAVFGAAGFRLLPIVNRIQGIILGLLGREPVARLALRQFATISSEVELVQGDEEAAVLELSHVTYRYPGGSVDVLNDVSLTFDRGKKYAVVGVSGSGKTTLIDLCMGLINPTSGSVSLSVDGRATVGYVPQDTVLTSSGLYGNVALEWDESHVDRERANRALKRASLEFMIEDPRFSERDFLTGLSGGQRQRLGLARALYREPDLLFLDEPTSALDVETEYEIMQAMDQLRGEVTVVIVAHRLSTIQDADVVIFMEDGKVLGEGSFAVLRESVPRFNRQVELGLLTEK
jgi:ABC-type multidrug transport system fused ATPase/permease subunit